MGTPSGANMEAPQNLAANLVAATGLAAGVANPAAATSGLSQDMAADSLGAPATSTTLHFCLVPGCLSGSGGRRPGWETDGQGLRNHVDAHLLGQLPGLPPETSGCLQGMRTYDEQTLQQWCAPCMFGVGLDASGTDEIWHCVKQAMTCQH